MDSQLRRWSKGDVQFPTKLSVNADMKLRQRKDCVDVCFTPPLDNSFAKWQSFDADAALAEADREEEERLQSVENKKDEPCNTKVALFVSERIIELKVKGNAEFKRKRYNAAIDLYTMALRLGVSRKKEVEPNEWNELMAQCYGNRAICYLKLEKLEDCVSDCNEAISCDSRYVKAWIRRASARKILKQYSQALEDYEQALNLINDEGKVGNESEEMKSLKKEIRILQLKQNNAHVPVKISAETVSSPAVLNPTLTDIQRNSNKKVDDSPPSLTLLSSSPPNISNRKVQTPYEFESLFHEIKQHPGSVYQLIITVNAIELKNLVSTVLDAEFLKAVFDSISNQFALLITCEKSCKEFLRALIGMSNARRFPMVMSFVEEIYKTNMLTLIEDVCATFPSLSAHCQRVKTFLK